MNLVLLGPPGAGKGTQAKRIAGSCGLPHISTGDMFREAIASGSDLGRRLSGHMTGGRLVPDPLVVEAVRERLSRPDTASGFLLDGFPRTPPQAEALDEVLRESGRELDHVLYIRLSSDEIVQRLSSRRVCPHCGASYNQRTQPPKEAGRCDVCGSRLVRREDDAPETVRERLMVYERQTRPLIDYYARAGILSEVDGAMPVEEVFKSLCAIIER